MNRYIWIILCILVVFAPSPAFGQEWIITNQATVTWDAVTTRSDGVPFPAGDQIAYSAYLADASTDPDKTNPMLQSTVFDTECVITLVDEGKYFVGLRTIRMSSDGAVIGESVIGWSDDPAIVVEGRTFGLRYFLPPAIPTGLRPGKKGGP
jgi:hypothetical protein